MSASLWRRRNRLSTDWARDVRRCGAPGAVAKIAAELASKHWTGLDVKACAQDRLAELLRCSVRTVSRWIGWLADHGWLTIEPAVNGQLALYTLTRPNRANQDATTGGPFYKGSTKTTRGDSPHPGQTLLGLRLSPARMCFLLPEPDPDRTTARQPRTPAAPARPLASAAAGYGT